MDRDKLIERLRSTFVAELQEHLRVLNHELLALEKQPEQSEALECVKRLFRAAHSLKGAAGAVNESRLANACHKLEEQLAGLRDGSNAITPEIVGTLFAAVDAVEQAGREFTRSTLVTAPLATKPLAVAVGSDVVTTSRTVSPPAAAESGVRPPAREPANQNLDSRVVVRVPGQKLDNLLTRSGELLVARRRFDLRRGQLANLQEQVATMRAAFRSAVPQLKSWATQHEQVTVAPVTRASRHADRVDDRMRELPQHKSLRTMRLLQDQLAGLERDLEAVCTGVAADVRGLERVAGDLEEQIHQVRMLPLAEACEGLFRAVRDLALSQGKEVELVVEGGELELDRAIVDALRDPLLHLVRNAVDHGIESPQQRRAQGKAARAKIVVSAAIRGELVDIVVRDDGRGVDIAAVRNAASQRADLDSASVEPLRVLFEAGFSTASRVTELSGRGVGLDVVKTRVEALRGVVDVTSESGKGACFTLTIPTTVTTLRVLFARAGTEVFGLPSSRVQRLVRATIDDIALVEGREVLLSGGAAPVPIVALSELLGLPAATPFSALRKIPMIVIGQNGQRVALAVEELLNEQDVVCKPLGKRIGRMRNVSAITILPTGRAALLLNPSDLLHTATARAPARPAIVSPRAAGSVARKRLLLVDDSATTRTLEKSILEGAGYEVMVAIDGSSAWQLLQDKGADLVISDVEMPNMDGFALTRAIRASQRFHSLPVVLLTSLESEHDRARGLEGGANAYLVKSAFDQDNLLANIAQLL